MAPPPNKVFGQTLRKRNGPTRYQRQSGNKSSSTIYRSGEESEDQRKAALLAERKRRKQAAGLAVEQAFGIDRFALTGAASEQESGATRRGWLYNVLPTTVAVFNETSGSNGAERAGLDLYFLSESGKDSFKSTVLYRPFFYVLPDLTSHMQQRDASQIDVVMELLTSTLLRSYEGSIYNVQVVYKLDLDQPNHLSPKNQKGRPMLKLIFDSVAQLMDVRSQLKDVIQKNQSRSSKKASASSWMAPTTTTTTTATTSSSISSAADQELLKDPLAILTDMREYDVPYVVRVCTDLNIRAGTWYTVELVADDPDYGGIRLRDPDRESKADPTFLAFDIECTKAPLKFPSPEGDEIFMISYMVRTRTGSQGYLIVSRSVVSQDVADFEYTPKRNYPGPFTIFNEKDEKSLLERFFAEYKKHGPQIVVTYNGDFFDWPFVEARAKHHGLDMFEQTGVEKVGEEYRGRCSVHLDAFHWVQRDSYLPQGAQGLKAVTKYKLGYDPVEVDPEDMVRFAKERPVHMATYSVSDAVATYYLYEKYVHLFIFSLCTIIPMGPEDVLRKGSGTLCETLLMTQACNKSIICPNKQVDPLAKFHNGHLLESETYIGGKVECLETGVFRSDIEYDFDLKPQGFQHLIDKIDRDLTFAIEVEGGKKKEDFVNYNEIRDEIVKSLEQLRDNPKRVEKPYIYHLDVGAMYPNIILSNRLQPSAMVDDATCAACDFNQSKNDCKRRMKWIWRGDYNPATKLEYDRTKDQLSRESFHGQAFHELPENEQAGLVASRLKKYSSRAYKKTKVTEEQAREEIVCMRENDFYVDTVRQFRDRRYEYKALKKTWSKKSANAKDAASKKECEDRVLVYDSLQVAHKCILNSFYGYVMRKGARWRSMEMAGIVTKTGADIITQARILVEQIGRPLELDTDGIWCILPNSFPDVYSFVSADGSKLKLEYPCVMLNAACHDNFSNHQYQTLVDPDRGIYSTRSECSIFFEVDGPYRCMVLPASTEEGKLLKKRYAVFNFDGSLAELKGFELKRRGELELIKTFQSQVFERFLDGGTLKECYDSVADIANHWIDVIDTRGESLDDDDLVDLISENRSMSRQLDDYGDQKGTSQTTARRLGEFLGAEIIKDKGLNCKFIISEQPYGAPVTERAVPTAIWKAEPAVMKTFLRKWLKAPGLDGDGLDIRNVLDWDYYMDRLAKTIQKIITIPAALQKVENPVPRVPHPSWLDSKVSQMNDPFQQKSITEMFAALPKRVVGDIEDVGAQESGSKRPVVRVRGRRRPTEEGEEESVSHERVVLTSGSFNDWLKQKKSLWLKTRRERRFQSTPGEVGPVDKRQKTTTSIEGFVRQAAMSLAQREWQIIEIREMTSYDALSPGVSYGSGEFIVWAVVGSDSLQKINITVPRIVHCSSRKEIKNVSSEIIGFRRVERHLPHSKSSAFLYEITMPEHIYRMGKWTENLRTIDSQAQANNVLECLYESGTPSLSRILSEVGSLVRLKPSSQSKSKVYSINDFDRVDQSTEGEYLHRNLSYKRLFLYIRIHPTTKTGIVALFLLDGGSGSSRKGYNDEPDLTRPTESGSQKFDIGASSLVWIVKPGSRGGQRNVSLKLCQAMFQQLLETISEEAGLESDYGCVSPESSVNVRSLKFVDNEELAYAGANEAISSFTKSNHGPCFILLNSSKPSTQLRRYMSTFSSSPVVAMPFPPGPAHNPALSTLPALNWESPAIQLSLEAYLFMVVISYPKRASYARYGQIPIGNLGTDENVALFDTGFMRLIEKNRALSWASRVPGKPDLGVNFLPSSSGGKFPSIESGSALISEEDIWEDDDELVSPVIRCPGVYRSLCVDIDVQDIAIAALTDLSVSIGSIGPGVVNQGSSDPSSPNNVALFEDGMNMSKVTGPLGDEMSTSISLPIVRALVSGWLRDAFTANSMVADELLHHTYRLISDPGTLLHDPALHRVVHALMKTTFMRVVGELQRLGCSIVYASFHRIVVATNKIELADAEEYINFVISTAQKRPDPDSEETNVLSKVSLKPKQFHTHFVFMDEYNFGTIQLERLPVDEIEESVDFVLPEGDENATTAVIPSVVTGWSLTNYLGSEIAQGYFRAIIGRFSKDVFKKQMDLLRQEDSIPLSLVCGNDERLLAYRRKMISKHFASYLTRAVDEILRDGSEEDEMMPPLLGNASRPASPALEFIKNVIVVLELDPEVQQEVHVLKRSLLSQIDVPEYSKAAIWTNPCPTFVLPDVFCAECQDSRDVNLCYIPPRDPEEDFEKHWACEDCGTLYDVTGIENRLLHFVYRKLARYQLQDLRCTKTHRVAKRVLAPLSDCSASLKLDIAPKEAQSELRLLRSLADLHELETLRQTTEGILASYQ